MGEGTAIHWVDDSVNPVMGCDGCELWSKDRKTCYAGVLTGIWGGSAGWPVGFDKVEPFPGRTAKAAERDDMTGEVRKAKPWLDGMPRMIFVSDMSDALSGGITFSYLRREIIDVADSPNGRRHVWLWLTKRPQRMAKFAAYLDDLEIDWPVNLWAGTSVTDLDSMPRINQLKQVGASIRFLSVEPQVEDIDLTGHLDGIAWIVQGGESGDGARKFELEWADSMREQCKLDGVAYFLKQLGANPIYKGQPYPQMDEKHGAEWLDWPKRLRVRDFPTPIPVT